MVNKTLPDKGPRAPATRLALANGGGAAAETNCDDAMTTSDETSVDNIFNSVRRIWTERRQMGIVDVGK